MSVTSFLYHQAEVLEHLLVGYCTEPEHDCATSEETALDRFTVAISREVGTPIREVAREVGERLGWPVYDREVPARIAHELHMPVAVVEDIDERRQSWLLECIESFRSGGELSESRYFRHLISVVRSLGEQGRCLIVGHGAAFLLPSHTTLRVSLVGDREERIAALRRSRRLDRWTAARQIDHLDREQSRFLRAHFHVDPSQSRNYDLVLNTSHWSPADCGDFILRALQHKAMGHLPS